MPNPRVITRARVARIQGLLRMAYSSNFLGVETKYHAAMSAKNPRERTRIWLSWSSGKDSAWALHVLRQDPTVEVVGLLTTVNQTHGRVAMHAVRRELLGAQARGVGLPVHVVEIPYPCSNEQYEAAMEKAIDAARRAGVQAVAFGDLFLEDIRAYREKQMEGTGLGTLFPLWQRPTGELAQEMIEGGLRAVLTCVDPKQCPEDFAGRFFDRALLRELPKTVDPCGERGEFHTFVFEGPIFQASLAIEVGEVVTRDGFVFADVVPIGS